jgi:hypothetical protein
MLTTFNHNQFQSVLSDTTVQFMPGLAQMGNAVVPFDGAVLPVSSMSGLIGYTGYYQNALMFLRQADATSAIPDMTRVLSVPVKVITDLISPSLPDSSSFPMGLFTLYSADGTTSQIVSSKSI